MARSLDTVVHSLVLGCALALTGAAFAHTASDLAAANKATREAQIVRLEPVSVTISKASYDAIRADGATTVRN